MAASKQWHAAPSSANWCQARESGNAADLLPLWPSLDVVETVKPLRWQECACSLFPSGTPARILPLCAAAQHHCGCALLAGAIGYDGSGSGRLVRSRLERRFFEEVITVIPCSCFGDKLHLAFACAAGLFHLAEFAHRQDEAENDQGKTYDARIQNVRVTHSSFLARRAA